MRPLAAVVVCVVLAAAALARAEEPPTRDWEVRITPYGWLTRIDGDIDSGGRSQGISVGIDDVLSHFGGGGMLNAGFRWRRWLVLGDLVVAKLTDNVKSGSVQVGPPALPIEVGPLKTDVTFWQVTSALNLGYRVLDVPFPGRERGEAGDPRRLFVDAYAGARYWYFDQKLKLRIPPATVGGMPVPDSGGSERIESDDRWVDPQVGFAVQARPWERWSFSLGGGVGGFGIGSASKIAWTGALEGSWHLGERWSLLAGYKALGFKRDFGSGTRIELDVTMHGPVLGASYRF